MVFLFVWFVNHFGPMACLSLLENGHICDILEIVEKFSLKETNEFAAAYLRIIEQWVTYLFTIIYS